MNGTVVGRDDLRRRGPRGSTPTSPLSLLREGANELRIVNVGDTGVYSLVFLDRFEIAYPQLAAARSGRLRGTWSPRRARPRSPGLAAPAALLDLDGPGGLPWLTGYARRRSSLRFRAEAGHRYLAVSRRGPPRPRVFVPRALRSPARRHEPGRLRPRRPRGLPRRRAAAPRAPGEPRASRPSPPPSRRSPPPSAAGSLPPRPSATSSPSPTTLDAGPRPATSSSSATPTYDPRHFNRRLPALAAALPPPEDLLPLDRLRPRSRRRQRGRRPPRPRHRTASRHHPRAGPDPRRQDPRLGGPGTEPRRHGRPRRRQPRPAGDFEADVRDIETLLPRRTRHDRDLPQPDRRAGDVARARDPRRLRPGRSPSSPTSATAAAPSGPPRTSSTPGTPPSLLAQPRQPLMLT